MDYSKVIEEAQKAKSNTYSPYSKFAVGAALLTKENKIYRGTNVENASYGATICAERSAIVSAISQGEKPENFKALAITSNMNKFTYPCGLCRQVMVELFNNNVHILMVNKDGEYKSVTIDELVPHKFTNKELKDV